MSLPTIAEILVEGYHLKQRYGKLYHLKFIDESWKRAVDKILKSIKGANIALVAVQGPPGTGKTSVYIEVLRQILMDRTSYKNEIFMYIAPTNQLVIETFRRFVHVLYDVLEIPKHVYNYIISRVRVYGSKIAIYNAADIRMFKDLDLDTNALNKLLNVKGVIRASCFDGIEEGPMFVFTTEWQRFNVAIPRIRIHMLVDEASRSPLHRPFITLVDAIGRKIAKGTSLDIVTLSVVGDPEQAIALETEYRGKGKSYLIMNRVKGVLEKLGLRDQGFEFLEITKRLPEPTEKPISIAYYDGKLKALKSRYEALRVFEVEAIRKACMEIKAHYPYGLVDKLCDLIETIISSQIPIGLIKVEAFPLGDTFDSKRVKIAALIAGIFTLAMNYSCTIYDIATISPYVDLTLGTALYYNKVFMSKVGSVRCAKLGPKFATVHSMLGDEADIVVSLLGKEWVKVCELREDPYLTIYFNEPELLNVQFSRHKRILIAIGDIERLRAKASEIAKLSGLRKKYYGLQLVQDIEKIERLCKSLENLKQEEGIPVLSLRR